MAPCSRLFSDFNSRSAVHDRSLLEVTRYSGNSTSISRKPLKLRHSQSLTNPHSLLIVGEVIGMAVAAIGQGLLSQRSQVVAELQINPGGWKWTLGRLAIEGQRFFWIGLG